MRDFQPSVLTNPAPVDIESFVENYLGMTPDYQLLSHNGIYLGMTVFNDTNRVIVFSQETGRAEYISAKAHTVIIDTRLLEENQEAGPVGSGEENPAAPLPLFPRSRGWP